MILWTIQALEAYNELHKKGYLCCDETKSLAHVDNDCFGSAYSWIVSKMNEKGIIKPEGVKYPIWAWYMWEGKRKRRDLRFKGFAPTGSKQVQLEIEIPDKEVLLTDFDLFHAVLNRWYIPDSEMDDKLFDEWLIRIREIKDFDEKDREYKEWLEKKKNSWDLILDIDRNINSYIDSQEKSIQATFWKLDLSQVKKEIHFIAK